MAAVIFTQVVKFHEMKKSGNFQKREGGRLYTNGQLDSGKKLDIEKRGREHFALWEMFMSSFLYV